MKVLTAQDSKIKLRSLLQDSNSKLEEIIGAVSSDPLLSASVLSIVNSPLFGLEEKVSSLHRAADLLGIGQFNEILLQEPAMFPLNVSVKQSRVQSKHFVSVDKCMA